MTLARRHTWRRVWEWPRVPELVVRLVLGSVMVWAGVSKIGTREGLRWW